MSDTNEAVASRVREHRTGRGWSQGQLGQFMRERGVTGDRATVSKIESCQRPLRSHELTALSEIFGVEIGDLTSGGSAPLPWSQPGRPDGWTNDPEPKTWPKPTDCSRRGAERAAAAATTRRPTREVARTPEPPRPSRESVPVRGRSASCVYGFLGWLRHLHLWLLLPRRRQRPDGRGPGDREPDAREETPLMTEHASTPDPRCTAVHAPTISRCVFYAGHDRDADHNDWEYRALLQHRTVDGIRWRYRDGGRS